MQRLTARGEQDETIRALAAGQSALLERLPQDLHGCRILDDARLHVVDDAVEIFALEADTSNGKHFQGTPRSASPWDTGPRSSRR